MIAFIIQEKVNANLCNVDQNDELHLISKIIKQDRSGIWDTNDDENRKTKKKLVRRLLVQTSYYHSDSLSYVLVSGASQLPHSLSRSDFDWRR